MKTSKKLIRKQRKFSEDFKRKIVADFESGKFSVPQLERLHHIANSLIYNWIYRYSKLNKRGQRIVEMKDSSSQKMKEMEERIKDLERIIGKKQIEIDFLEKLIEVANEELHIDIKKNSYTPQSNSSEKINKT